MAAGGGRASSLSMMAASGRSMATFDEDDDDDDDVAPDRRGVGSGSRAPPSLGASGNERLYEAYNELHAVANAFDKPFDSPAILVVGHQTDGKSGALFGCHVM